MLFLTALESVLSIVLIIVLGFYLRHKGYFADSFAGNISKLIMNIALPASIFISVLSYLTRETLFSLSDGLIYGTAAIFLGYIIAWLMTKAFNIRAGRKGVFINTIVNANTIFIGLPLNIALFGENSMPYFLVYYVLNTISTWTFGAWLIARDSSQSQSSPHRLFNWKKLLPPPLLGFLVALIFLLINIPVPNFIHSALSYIGAMVTPLSLIYIGITLYDAGLKSLKFDKDTITALIGKFAIAPAIMVFLIFIGKTVLPLPTIEAQTLILQSSVSALAILPILANEAKGDVSFATNIVTTSTLLFIPIVPLIDGLLGLLN
ncbi:AEC family transporter [Avibacterium sp. 20-15]|uniref:AEC family transporter n=1 Tax=unclassified Avibacterium TaxID=2685287 RepID=UPI002026D527|nr:MULTISPECIES: AEC family transporter [unclassified Avibacterium]MCW9733668.1 AEC family transporter [Avibacterium sp. 20-15]URL03522.1 AEC family transporter [Avibacterium sp. 20-132]